MNALAQHFARDRRRSLIWAVGITVALLLAAGGALAGSALSGSPGPSPEAATLNAALSSNGTTASAPAGKARAKAGAIARLRRLGGMYGEVTYRGQDSSARTLAFERGVVTSAGSDLVVKAANGTTWTWQFTGSTVVRKGGAKVSRSDLASGEHVLLAGPVVSGARDARLVFIAGARHPAGTAPTPSPSAPASGPASAS
jgi:hypothetical protein